MKRRQLLAGTAAAILSGAGLASARAASEKPSSALPLSGRLVPGARFDQSRALNDLISASQASGAPVFLPAGDYRVSNIVLPDGIQLSGVPGETRLIYSGEGALLSAENAARVTLSGLTLHGADLPLGEGVSGLADFHNVAEVVVSDCTVRASAMHGIALDRCGGRVENSSLALARQSGLYALDSRGLAITGNTVADCANGGILVHRSKIGEDGTIVSRNRIARIRAAEGGTGENGNGINIFRGSHVIVSDNHVSDCAFSAIRANSGSGAMIRGNQCLNSGETALYAEFAFEGAIISDNLVDGAANGILIVNFDEGGRLATVSGNVVRNLKLDGPYLHDGAGFGFGIAAEADTVISANIVENAPKYGLMLGWGPYMRSLSATGNIVRNTPVGCAVTVVEGAGHALITDNLFEGVSESAISGYRWNDRTVEDLTAAGAPVFTHLTIAGNRRV